MKNLQSLTILLAVFFLSQPNSKAQCDGNRFLNMIFSEVEVTSAVPFGNNYNFQGEDQTLLLDVYEPASDEMAERPLLILVHGGSFIAGARDEVDVLPLCHDFAKMGYVVASIDYRLGLVPNLNELEPQLANAMLRGVHDLKAAIRYFRKSVAEEGNPYGIDSDKIMAAGVSAGGFVTLHHAYMDQENEIPEMIDQSQIGLGGGLEGNSGNEGYSSEVLGIVNIAGALRDTSMMEPNDEPVCNFHGTEDITVPFGSDTLYFLNQFAVAKVDGSEAIDQQADDLEIPNCFEIYESAGHVPHVSNSFYYDTTRAVMSNFLAHLVCGVELDCSYRELETGISEVEKNEVEISLHPNPTKNSLFVSLIGSERGQRVKVYHANGVLTKDLKMDQNKIDLNVIDLSPGLYVIEVTTGRQVLRKSFVKN